MGITPVGGPKPTGDIGGPAERPGVTVSTKLPRGEVVKNRLSSTKTTPHPSKTYGNSSLGKTQTELLSKNMPVIVQPLAQEMNVIWREVNNNII